MPHRGRRAGEEARVPSLVAAKARVPIPDLFWEVGESEVTGTKNRNNMTIAKWGEALLLGSAPVFSKLTYVRWSESLDSRRR